MAEKKRENPRVLKFALCDVTGFVLETRRVLAPEEETFEALTAAVESIFGLDVNEHDIIWSDEEGDDIIVRSSEELVAARRGSGTTSFKIRLKTPKIRSKFEERDYERRRFGDKVIVDKTLIVDDGTKTKGRWVSSDRFVATVPPATTRLPGQSATTGGTFVAVFDYFGARTAFLAPAVDLDDDDVRRFDAWDRREAWTWSDERKQKFARVLPTPAPTPTPGTFVALENLKDERYNGARGIVAVNKADGRSVVELFAPYSDLAISVKSHNMKTVFDADLEDFFSSAVESMALNDLNQLRMEKTPLLSEGVPVGFFTTTQL